MNRKFQLTSLLLVTFLLLNHQFSNGCTNFLVTRGASTDGSTMITYSADSHTLVW
jgi:hypothetical protein